MTAQVFKTLKKCDQVRWYCKGKCGETLDNVMQLLNSVCHRLEQAESQVANLDKRVNQAEKNVLSDEVKTLIQEEVCIIMSDEKMADEERAENRENQDVANANNEQAVKDEVKRLFQEELPTIKEFTDIQAKVQTLENEAKSYADIVRERPTATNDGTIPWVTNETEETDLAELVAIQVREEKEREAKRNNIIISNLPEGEPKNDVEKQRLEDMELTGLTDEQMIDELWKKINTPSTSLKIESMKRLPERIEARRGDRPRPILIKFRDMESKRKVLDNAWHLGGHDNWKNQVYIEMDKTRYERERDFQLRETRRKRLSDGEENLVIRSGKIVKLAPLGAGTRGGRGGRPFPRGRGGGGRQGGGRR